MAHDARVGGDPAARRRPPAPCAMLRTRRSLSGVCARRRAVRAGLAARGRRASRWPPWPPTREWATDVSIGAFVVDRPPAPSIGDRTVVFPNVTIGPGARVGADCVIHSNVSIRERVVIGDRVVLQNGVVVGSDGYGFVRRGDGTHEKIPQVADRRHRRRRRARRQYDGRSARRSARRASGSGTKIDNLVQIAHGVTVGPQRAAWPRRWALPAARRSETTSCSAGRSGVGGHLTIGGAQWRWGSRA